MNFSGSSLSTVSDHGRSRHSKSQSEKDDFDREENTSIVPFHQQESIRSTVATAAVSIFSRLILLRGVLTAAGKGETVLEAAVTETISEVEQTLHELLSQVPEDDAQLNARVTDDADHTSPSIDLRGTRDPDTLNRTIALLRQRVLEDQVLEKQQADERFLVEQSMSRRIDQLENVNHQLQHDLLVLQGDGGVELQKTFLSLDLANILTHGHTERHFQHNVLELIELLSDDRVRDAAGDERFRSAFDRIRELERDLQRLSDKSEIMKRRVMEERRKVQSEKVHQERKMKDLRIRIEDLERIIQQDKSQWAKMESELSTLKADKEALLQNVELAEQKVRTERQKFFVKLAEVTMKAHHEQLRREVDFELLPDPENVDLAKQIASTGIATDVSEEILEKIISVTNRPDDPSRLASADYLVDRVEFLTREVNVLRTLASRSFENEFIERAASLDATEDVQRVLSYCRDTNCPIPPDLTRMRADNETLSLYSADSNAKEIARVLRLDAKVAARRLHTASKKLLSLEDYILEAFCGDTVASGLLRPANASSPTPNLAARMTKQQSQSDDHGDPSNDAGPMLEEVAKVERLEYQIRERVLEGSRTIRRLTAEVAATEKFRAAERLLWAKQWKVMLDVLPYSIAADINMEGLAALEHQTVRTEILQAHHRHVVALEAERQSLLAEVEAAKQRSLEAIKEQELAAAAKLAALKLQAQQLRASSPTLKKTDSRTYDEDSDDERRKRKVVTTEHQTQTVAPPRGLDDWTQVDNELKLRQGKQASTNTNMVDRSDRGVQAHVLGLDVSVEADLEPPKPPFDEDAAQALFKNLQSMLQQPKSQPKVQEKIPRRILCPQCGDSISVFRPAPDAPEKGSQTEGTNRNKKCDESPAMVFVSIVSSSPMPHGALAAAEGIGEVKVNSPLQLSLLLLPITAAKGIANLIDLAPSGSSIGACLSKKDIHSGIELSALLASVAGERIVVCNERLARALKGTSPSIFKVRRSRNTADIDGQPVFELDLLGSAEPSFLTETEEITLLTEDSEDEGVVSFVDTAVQCTDVVIMTNDEFNSMKRQGGTPTTPLVRPFSSGSNRIGTPKKSHSTATGGATSRPTTAAMKQLTMSMGYQLTNRDYEDSVRQLCTSVHPLLNKDCVLLDYSGDLNTCRLLQQVAALCNARFLLRMRESEQEQQLKLHAVSSLSSLLSDLGCTDSATLPSPVPFFLLTEWSPDAEAQLHVRQSTTISEAFAPVLNAVADACRKNRIASRSGGKNQAVADLDALQAKVSELDELLRRTAQHVGGAQIAGSFFGRSTGSYESVLGSVAGSPDFPTAPSAEAARPPLHRSNRLPSLLDDDGTSSDDDAVKGRSEKKLLAEFASTRRPSRVLVKPLSKTASIRKTINLDTEGTTSQPHELSTLRFAPSAKTPPILKPLRQQENIEIVRRSNSPPLSNPVRRGLRPLAVTPLSPKGSSDIVSSASMIGEITEAFMERFATSPK